jgi:hypothetical protein
MDRLAVLRGGTHLGNGGLSQGQGNTIALYGVKLPGLPTLECLISGAVGGEFGRPSWSPDGRSLAWAEGNGIWAGQVGRDCSGAPKLRIPGGRDPDWGPAGVARGAAKPVVHVSSKMSRGEILSRGVRVNVSCPSSCQVKAAVRSSGRTIARGSRRLDGGNGRLLLRPTRLGTVDSLSIRVRVKPGGTYVRTVPVR